MTKLAILTLTALFLWGLIKEIGHRHRAALNDPFFNLFVSNLSKLLTKIVQYTLDLRKPDLRKNLDLRKIVGATDFLVHKLFDLRKIF